MPPKTKITKEDIICCAYDIVKNEGADNINVRKIAEYLGCSTQPIYHNFRTVDELKMQVTEKIHGTYTEYMQKGSKHPKPYFGMGMAYINFARDFPNFFRLLFMSESKLSPVDFITNDSMRTNSIESGRMFSGLTQEQQKKFHLQVWIFTHGLAALAATNTVSLTDEEIENILGNTVREMLIGFKLKSEENS